jgi:hypothetical protein
MKEHETKMKSGDAEFLLCILQTITSEGKASFIFIYVTFCSIVSERGPGRNKNP